MQASNRGNSQPVAGPSTPNDLAKNILGTAATVGNFPLMKGWLSTFSMLFSWLVMPFFRINYGYRTLSFWVLFLSWVVMSFIGSLDLLFSRVLPFSSSLVSQNFGLHLMLWKCICVFHFASNWWAENVREELRYSWHCGDSVLFPFWLRIGRFSLFEKLRNLPYIKQLPGGLWYDQDLFQQYIEPAIVLLIGYLLQTSGDSFYGVFLIFCGLGLAYQKYTERETARNARYDFLDAQYVARVMMQAQQPQMPVTENEAVSTGVVEMADAPAFSSNGNVKTH